MRSETIGVAIPPIIAGCPGKSIALCRVGPCPAWGRPARRTLALDPPLRLTLPHAHGIAFRGFVGGTAAHKTPSACPFSPARGREGLGLGGRPRRLMHPLRIRFDTHDRACYNPESFLSRALTNWVFIRTGKIGAEAMAWDKCDIDKHRARKPFAVTLSRIKTQHAVRC